MRYIVAFIFLVSCGKGGTSSQETPATAPAVTTAAAKTCGSNYFCNSDCNTSLAKCAWGSNPACDTMLAQCQAQPLPSKYN